MYKLNKMNYSKINVTKMNYCEISKNANLPKRITILQFMCGISYLYIYYIVYKRIITSLKKKDEDNVDEEEENLTLIRPVDEEETLQIYELEGTCEQLRRLRAYNPKNDDETEEDYLSRIWSIADKEDEEEKKEREIKRKEKMEEKMEEKDVNTWYIVQDGKARYKGEWKNDLPNGKGTYERFEGLNKDSNGKPCDSNGKPTSWYMLECNFVNGVAEGYGKQIYKQEDEEIQPYYEGEFKNSYHHGQGAYYYGTGEYHKGNFKESKFHGVGFHYYPKKNISWVGEFDNDKIINGVRLDGELYQIENKQVKVEEVKVEEKDINIWYTLEDRTARYKGEWKNGLPNGKGIKHIYKTDSYIEGNFVDGFADGYGKQSFEKTWEKTVPYYEGEFKRNQWHGKGEYHYGDGDYYKGDWKDSKYHGQGTAYSNRLDRTWVGEYCNEEKVNGNWVMGEI